MEQNGCPLKLGKKVVERVISPIGKGFHVSKTRRLVCSELFSSVCHLSGNLFTVIRTVPSLFQFL